MTKIRHASLNDLEKLSEVESLCFPPAEAAGRQSIEGRLADDFWCGHKSCLPAQGLCLIILTFLFMQTPFRKS